MDCYYVVGVTTIPYPTFGVLINISKWISHTMSQLVTYHIIHALTWQKCHLNFWERNGSGCIAKIFIMCFHLFVKQFVILTASFTLQRTPITRSCSYINLQVLQKCEKCFKCCVQLHVWELQWMTCMGDGHELVHQHWTISFHKYSW